MLFHENLLMLHVPRYLADETYCLLVLSPGLWMNYRIRYLHGDGDDGNPTESLGILQGWKIMMWGFLWG